MKSIGLKILTLAMFLFLGACQALDNTESNVKSEKTVITNEPVTQREFLMGTTIALTVYDSSQEKAVDLAFNRIRELSELLDVNSDGVDSEIKKINQAAGLEAVGVSDEVFYLIEKAKDYSLIENSGFDLTIGPIVNLWRIGFKDARRPSDLEISENLKLVHAEAVILDNEKQSVFLEKEGMLLDLGAIAKGFIADEVCKVLTKNGVEDAIIDLGGNIVVMGNSPRREAEGFVVGVQDPQIESKRGDYIATISLKNQSIVTSGIYERYLELDGEFYHHLLDPETGYPFESDLISATIFSPSSLDADAIATMVFGMEIEEAMTWLETQKVEAVLVKSNHEVYITNGLENQLNLTDENFKLK